MVKKPINKNGFKGDTKLKHIIPKYDRQGYPSPRPRTTRVQKPKEIVAETEKDFKFKKDVREEKIGSRPGLFKKGKTDDTHPPTQSTGTMVFKLIAVIIGLLILISSMVIAYQNRDEMSEVDEDSIIENGYQFLEDLLVCQALSSSTPPERGVYSSFKIEYVTAEEILQSLQTEYNFYIEIIDTSENTIQYSRSSEDGNAITNVDLNQVPQIIRSDGSSPFVHYDADGYEVLLMNSFINIKVSDTEIHSAKLMVMIWD
jgi:hypothetical protein